jgi:hypothetical protein
VGGKTKPSPESGEGFAGVQSIEQIAQHLEVNQFFELQKTELTPKMHQTQKNHLTEVESGRVKFYIIGNYPGAV